MKVAVPSEGRKGLEEKVAEHFGRCAAYTILDGEGEVLDIIDNISSHQGGSGLPPELLKSHNVDHLLCRGIGTKALQMCQNFGIKVYVADSSNVEELVKNWLDHQLPLASLNDTCKERHS
ncbi:MAG: NifB/NifX family molybdenum-iron cluster-binding protein [Chlamydiota bacterium]